MEFSDTDDGEIKHKRWSVFSDALARRAGTAEIGFLSLLRYAALLVAGIVLIGSVVLFGLGLMKQVGRTEIEAESVSVTANEIVPPKVNATKSDASPRLELKADKKLGISQIVRQKTLKIFKDSFKSYQRSDAKITEQQVVDFIWSEDRIEMFDGLAGRLVDANDKVLTDREAVMGDALSAVSKAVQTAEFKKQLGAYRDAKKANVCTEQTRTRVRTIESWDSSATYCSSWYISPVGCASERTVNEPYVEKVCAMKFPDNLEAPEQQFAGALQRYAVEAVSKLENAQTEADLATSKNEARKADGWANLFTSGQLFLGFLFVMFLYLFVAIERHHRTLTQLLKESE
jgi:hypothetical protein